MPSALVSSLKKFTRQSKISAMIVTSGVAMVYPDRSVLILQGIELDLVDVAPAPVLTRLGGLHDGVAARMEVFRRMLVLGGGATADVSARRAETGSEHPG